MIKRILKFFLYVSLTFLPVIAYADYLDYEWSLDSSSYNYWAIHNSNIKLETWGINNKIFYSLEYKGVKRYYFFTNVFLANYPNGYRVFYRDISYEFWDINNVALQVFLIWNGNVRLTTDIIVINKNTWIQNVLDSRNSLWENLELFSCINGNYSVFKSNYTNFVYLPQYGSCLTLFDIFDYSRDYTAFSYWSGYIKVNNANSFLFYNFVWTNATQWNTSLPPKFWAEKRVSKFWDKLIVSAKWGGNKYVEGLYRIEGNGFIEEEYRSNKDYSIFFSLWYKWEHWYYLVWNLTKNDLRVIKIEWDPVERRIEVILWSWHWETWENDSVGWGDTSSPPPDNSWWGFSYFDFLKPKWTDFSSVNIWEQTRVSEHNSNDLFFSCNYEWAVSGIFDIVKIDFTIPFINYRINFQPLSWFACPFTTLIGKQYAYLSIGATTNLSNSAGMLDFHNKYTQAFFSTERSLWDILVIIIIWAIWFAIIIKFNDFS